MTCEKCGAKMPEPKLLPGEAALLSWQKFCPDCVEFESKQQQAGLDITQTEDSERQARKWLRANERENQ